VYVTKDMGVSWAFVASNTFQYSWGDAGRGDVPESRIYMVVPDQSVERKCFT
jgi:hypothetical protein